MLIIVWCHPGLHRLLISKYQTECIERRDMSPPAIQDQNAFPAAPKTVVADTPPAPASLALEEIQLAHVSTRMSAAAEPTAQDVEEGDLARGKFRVAAIFTALAVGLTTKRVV